MLMLAPCAGEISDFHEKPTGSELERLKSVSKNATEQNPYEASMGIYVFKRDALVSNLLRPVSLLCPAYCQAVST